MRQLCRYEKSSSEGEHVSEDSRESPEERRGRFLRWAARARESAAKSSTPEGRNNFLAIAKSWKSMADQIRDAVVKVVGR